MLMMIRALVPALLGLSLGLPMGAAAQSRLPPCPADAKVRLQACYGERTWPDGARYVGEFRGDLRNGQGTYVLPNGDRYVGEWRDGKFHGQGTFTSADGRRYTGEWRDDKRHGQGTWTHPNGERYVGEWRDDKRHGRGTLTIPTGERFAGEFREDRLEGPATVQGAPAAARPAPVTEKERLAAEVEAERRKRVELEERLAAETRERQRLAAEISQAARATPPSTANPSSRVADARLERRVALVVGNGAYKTAPLANPGNDAVDMATALQGVGFQVTTLRDASLRQMREATRRFEEAAVNADVALIFFAGHGIEAKGRNFMIPVDADIAREYELEDQAFDAGQWLSMLEGARGQNAQRVNIVILDACRDDPLTRKWRSSAGRGLGRMDAPSGTLLVYSTSPGRVAADGPRGQRNSPFTKSLLQAMQQPHQPIEQVLKEVRRQVMQETNGDQVPWENSSLVGDFVFRR
jgi:hypothetical protein